MTGIVKENIKGVELAIRSAMDRSHRKLDSVTLIGVTKTKSAELVREAYHAGLRNFGENYVQEFRQKAELLSDLEGLRWHFIGSLQRNKCKHVVGNVFLIHSVDRMELAREISKVAAEKGIIQDCLIEINLGNEETKSGFPVKMDQPCLEELSALKNIRWKGLMALPPLSEDKNIQRGYFRTLRQLAEEIHRTTHLRLSDLSMGTSHDFELAIEEGATYVRVGTSIFGERT